MSNYETMKDRMSSHFLEYDQEKMIRKFALDHDEKYLYIFFVGRKYRINRVIPKNTVIPLMNGFISAAFLRCGEEIWQMTVTFSGMQERNSMERLQNWRKPASDFMGSGWKKAMWLISWTCFHFFPLY